MKKYEKAIIALAALNLIVAAAFIAVMPDQVAVHFGPGGEADKIGSKYQLFIMTAGALLLGILSIADARTTERSNKLSKLKIGVGVQILFIGITVVACLIVLSPSSVETPSSSIFNMSKASALVIGILLIICGNLMPKSTMNSTFGIRLPWSMESDEIWRKTQRFGGYVTILCGLALVMFGILLDGSQVFVAIMITMALWALACGVISYVVYKRERD